MSRVAVGLLGAGAIIFSLLELTIPGKLQAREERLRRRRRDRRASKIRALGGVEGIPPGEREVLVAIADLFLDTETAPEHLGKVLASSPFEWRDLRRMLMHDLAPSLWANMLSVAGEWSGWNEEWLLGEVVLNRASWLRWAPPLRWALGFTASLPVGPDWRKVRGAFMRERTIRGADPQGLRSPDA